MSSMSVESSSVGPPSSGGANSSESKEAAIMKQIAQLTKQLLNLKNDTTLEPEEKTKQQELIQNQIKMLYEQLARIQQEAADKAKQKQETANLKDNEKVADGINRPTAENFVDLYI